MKGLRVNVLRNTLGDCTNGGVTSRFETFTLVGPGVEGPFEPTEKAPPLVLCMRTLRDGFKYFHAEPIEHPNRHSMAGGNFIHSSDARFAKLTGGYPISVHDRFE